MKLSDLEYNDLGSPKLYAILFFSKSIFHKNLAILAFIGAELAGEQILHPASFPGA